MRRTVVPRSDKVVRRSEEEVRGQNCTYPSCDHRPPGIVRSRGLAAKAAGDESAGFVLALELSQSRSAGRRPCSAY